MQRGLPFDRELPPEGGSHTINGGEASAFGSPADPVASTRTRKAGASPPPRDPVASAFRRKPEAGAKPDLQLSTGTESFDVHFVRVRRAKRYVLRVRPDGGLRVTIPRGGSRAEALRFAERHLAWAARERARSVPAPRIDPAAERALRGRARDELV